jgi:hypothetical protein
MWKSEMMYKNCSQLKPTFIETRWAQLQYECLLVIHAGESLLNEEPILGIQGAAATNRTYTRFGMRMLTEDERTVIEMPWSKTKQLLEEFGVKLYLSHVTCFYK